MLTERLDYFRIRVRKFLEEFEPSKDILADFESFGILIEGDLFKDCTDYRSISWKLYSTIYHGKKRLGYNND
jgi:hypothetical protein